MTDRSIFNDQNGRIFTWRVSDCEELSGGGQSQNWVSDLFSLV